MTIKTLFIFLRVRLQNSFWHMHVTIKEEHCFLVRAMPFLPGPVPPRARLAPPVAPDFLRVLATCCDAPSKPETL